jgi:hypothetical protein
MLGHIFQSGREYAAIAAEPSTSSAGVQKLLFMQYFNNLIEILLY